MTWQAEMKDGYWLGRDHPDVYLGERQALNEDYTHSGFDRGHLNPNGHHAGNSGSICPVTGVVGGPAGGKSQEPMVGFNRWNNTSCSHALHRRTNIEGVFAKHLIRVWNHFYI